MLRALLILSVTILLLACGKKGNLLPPPTDPVDKTIQPHQNPTPQ